MTYSDEFLSQADPQNLLNIVMRQGQEIEELRQSILTLQRLSGVASEIGELAAETVNFASGAGRLDENGVSLTDAGDAILFYDAVYKQYATISLQSLESFTHSTLRLTTFRVSEEDNQVGNGDFETGDSSGWTVTDPSSLLTIVEDGYNSAYCAQIAEGDTVTLEQSLAAAAPVGIVVTFKVKTVGATGVVYLEIGAAQRVINLPADINWRTCVLTLGYYIPVTDIALTFEADPGGTLFVDDVVVRRLDSDESSVDVVPEGLRVRGSILQNNGAEDTFEATSNGTRFGNLVAFKGIISATLVANVNDYNPAGIYNNNVLLLTSTSNVNITGIKPNQTDDEGEAYLIINEGSNSITLKNEDAGSGAAYRFKLSADIVLTPNTGCTIWYNTTANRWMAIGQPGAAGQDFSTFWQQPFLFDEFTAGLGTSGNIGSLGWLLGAGTVTGIASTTKHPGVIRLNTGITANTVGRLVLSPVTAVMPVLLGDIKRVQFLIYLPASQTSGVLEFGLVDTPATPSPVPSGALFLQNLTSANISTWTKDPALGFESHSSLTVSAFGGWHLFEIVINKAGPTVEFWADGVLMFTHTTYIVLSLPVTPAIMLQTQNTVAKTMDIDFFGIQYQPMTTRW